MINTSTKKTPMTCLEPQQRAKTFDEVALGYTIDEAIAESQRCLNCKNPTCLKGCPVGVNIPLFIKEIANSNFELAFNTVYEKNSLPAICGRVCPQEKQCEMNCVRAIKGESVAIGRLERFVADWFAENCEPKPNNVVSHKQKVAVIGSGPAGLSAANSLNQKGYNVEIFEALHDYGGVLAYGIPEFRLPKKILAREVEMLKKNGVLIHTDVVIGRTLTIEDLFDEGFEAVFIGTGAGLPKFMNIEGENLNGVYSANEYLTRINLMKSYQANSNTPILRAKKVAVVGGGNVAMDCARCAIRMGSEVYLVYRRGESELPARKEEVEHAKQEGVRFELLTNPVRILGDDNCFVKGIECVKMELGEPDESGRRRPQVVQNSNFVLDLDCVIMALGTNPNPIIKDTTAKLETNKHGCITVENNCQTSIQGVFAGGDAVTGSATVISAMGAGKIAAEAIDAYLKNKIN